MCESALRGAVRPIRIKWTGTQNTSISEASLPPFAEQTTLQMDAAMSLATTFVFTL
jgi:hypothetical protein